jgi:hypothetical protein
MSFSTVACIPAAEPSPCLRMSASRSSVAAIGFPARAGASQHGVLLPHPGLSKGGWQVNKVHFGNVGERRHSYREMWQNWGCCCATAGRCHRLDGLPFDGADRVEDGGCLEEQWKVKNLPLKGLGREAGWPAPLIPMVCRHDRRRRGEWESTEAN